jgi:predicted nucleotidyltransferase
MYRDRDYILDSSGRILRVIGDYHPVAGVVSYVKYFPSEDGARSIEGLPGLFGYNSFVSKSFSISLGLQRACFSQHQGGVVPYTPYGDIVRHFSCDMKLQEIWHQKARYMSHPVGRELITFLEAIADRVDLTHVGITGSFLIGGQLETSDIDLVCYGRESYEQMSRMFHASPILTPYTEPALARRLYQRRMIHLAPMEFKTLILQESRKLQGVTKERGTHINCQPLRDLTTQSYADLVLAEVGEIACIVEILNHDDGYYAPAFYSIRVVDIIESLFDVAQIQECARTLISFGGTYSSTFRAHDRVFVEGKLVQMSTGTQSGYGIEVTPWNTSRAFHANLLA